MGGRSRRTRIGATVVLLVVGSVTAAAPPAGVATAGVPIEGPVTAPVDLDGNGTSDLVWWDFMGGAVAMWTLGPGGVVASNAFEVDTTYRFVGAGDVDRDGDADLVWQRQRTVFDNVVVVWEMDGPSVRSTAAFWPPRDIWRAQAVADLDGDDAADVVLTAPDPTTATTPVAVWFLDGMHPAEAAWAEYAGPRLGGARIGAIEVGATVSGIGDFDGDGDSSVVLTDPTMWPPAWSRFDVDRAGSGTFTPFDWWLGRYGYTGISGAFGDFDGDGTTDAYWHHTGTLQPPTSDVSSIERYVGNTPAERRTVQWPSARLLQLQIGDFDGSGTADLAWWYCGHLAIWLTGQDGGFTALDLGPYPSERNWVTVPQPSDVPLLDGSDPLVCPPG